MANTMKQITTFNVLTLSNMCISHYKLFYDTFVPKTQEPYVSHYWLYLEHAGHKDELRFYHLVNVVSCPLLKMHKANMSVTIVIKTWENFQTT